MSHLWNRSEGVWTTSVSVIEESAKSGTWRARLCSGRITGVGFRPIFSKMHLVGFARQIHMAAGLETPDYGLSFVVQSKVWRNTALTIYTMVMSPRLPNGGGQAKLLGKREREKLIVTVKMEGRGSMANAQVKGELGRF